MLDNISDLYICVFTFIGYTVHYFRMSCTIGVYPVKEMMNPSFLLEWIVCSIPCHLTNVTPKLRSSSYDRHKLATLYIYIYTYRYCLLLCCGYPAPTFHNSQKNANLCIMSPSLKNLQYDCMIEWMWIHQKLIY